MIVETEVINEEVSAIAWVYLEERTHPDPAIADVEKVNVHFGGCSFLDVARTIMGDIHPRKASMICFSQMSPKKYGPSLTVKISFDRDIPLKPIFNPPGLLIM